jgi:hypothetical protein
MARIVASKVLWVGRGTALAFGLAATVALLLAVTRSSEAATQLSLERTDYPVGVEGAADLLQSLALADLDGDSDPDAITANPGSDTVSVLLNQGDGTFGASVQETACDQARDLVVGNLDSNNAGSTPDALIQCTDLGGVTLLGDGNGGFADPIDAGVCCSIGEMALGYLNTADGGLDVAYKGPASNNERVLCHAIGDGSGGFINQTCAIDPNTNAFTPISNTGEIALADLDGDGMNNVITFNKTNDKVLFFNDYDLANHPITGFSPVPSERTTGSSDGRSLSPGDIDGDSDTDLVVGNSFSSNISVFVWGANGFDPAVQPVVYPSVTFLQDTALGDIDGDENMDVLAVGENKLAVHLGNGDGTFDAAVEFDLPGSPHRVRIKVADLDGDGVDDAAVTVTNTSGVDLLSVFSREEADTTPPTLNVNNDVTPSNGARGVKRKTSVSATFSEPMKLNSLTPGVFTLKNTKTGAMVEPVDITFSPDGKTATLDPFGLMAQKLARKTRYEVRIKGGPGGAADVAGNALAADAVWTFTTRRR